MQRRAVRWLEMLVLFLSVPLSVHGSILNGRFWGGVGVLSGNVTYRIGGLFSSPQGSFNYWFPLSELQWPVNATVATAGGELKVAEQWEIGGEFSGNVPADSGKIRDSDWTDAENTQLKTIYSESNATLQSLSGDLNVRYWFAVERLAHGILGAAIGGGWSYGYFYWDASNLDQWYPANPEMGHDVVHGLIGTYAIRTSIPYFQAAGKVEGSKLSLLVRAGYSPFAVVEDTDDHILRRISSTVRAQGDAYKIILQGRYDFMPEWFLRVTLDMLWLDISGRDLTVVYAGADQGDTWSIEHRIVDMHYVMSLAAGMRF